MAHFLVHCFEVEVILISGGINIAQLAVERLSEQFQNTIKKKIKKRQKRHPYHKKIHNRTLTWLDTSTSIKPRLFLYMKPKNQFTEMNNVFIFQKYPAG
jgi:hypothetical protein